MQEAQIRTKEGAQRAHERVQGASARAREVVGQNEQRMEAGFWFLSIALGLLGSFILFMPDKVCLLPAGALLAPFSMSSACMRSFSYPSSAGHHGLRWACWAPSYFAHCGQGRSFLSTLGVIGHSCTWTSYVECCCS